MRIWLINIGEQIPSDPGSPRLLRTGILSRHLSERGHQVTWWNATLNHQQKIQRSDQSIITDTAEGYRLILLHGRKYRRNISPSRILSHIENARAFRQIAAGEPQPDVILCGYPTIELAHAATLFAVEHNIPIAIDHRDMWPDIFEEHIPTGLKWSTKALFSRWRKHQKYCAEHATAITGITQAFVDWGLSHASRAPTALDKPFHLAVNPQVPKQSDLENAKTYWKNSGIVKSDAHLIGCFAGVLSKRVDLQSLVRGASQLPDDLKSKTKLVFCGKGDLAAELEQATSNQPHIFFAGWRNAAELSVLLNYADFGMLPYPSTTDFKMSFPNKVGEYLSAGLPIMTGLQGQTRMLLEKQNLGYFYEEGNPDSVTKCLVHLLADKNRLLEKSMPAVQTFEALFDGRKIYPEFCEYIEQLATIHPTKK